MVARAMRANFGLRANQKIRAKPPTNKKPPQAARNPTTASGAGKFVLLAIGALPIVDLLLWLQCSFPSQSLLTKLWSLFFPSNADPLFHLIEIFGQGSSAGGGQAIFGARNASFKKLDAGNVLGLLELAGVHAEIAVGGLEHALKVVEAQRIVGCERTDDAEANALMNQAIEFGEFGSARRRRLMNLPAGLFPRLLPQRRSFADGTGSL